MRFNIDTILVINCICQETKPCPILLFVLDYGSTRRPQKVVNCYRGQGNNSNEAQYISICYNTSYLLRNCRKSFNEFKTMLLSWIDMTEATHEKNDWISWVEPPSFVGIKWIQWSFNDFRTSPHAGIQLETEKCKKFFQSSRPWFMH